MSGQRTNGGRRDDDLVPPSRNAACVCARARGKKEGGSDHDYLDLERFSQYPFFFLLEGKEGGP